MTNKKNDLSAFVNIKPQGVFNTVAKVPVRKLEKLDKNQKTSRTVPWRRVGLDPSKIVNVSFRISEVEREMLKYIRAQSGASANHTLRSLVIREVEKTAAALWKKESG